LNILYINFFGFGIRALILFGSLLGLRFRLSIRGWSRVHVWANYNSNSELSTRKKITLLLNLLELLDTK